MRLLLVCCVLLPIALARRAFPVQTDVDIEKLLQTQNSGIDYDDENYLVDESGPYAVCENVEKKGRLTVRQKAWYREKFEGEVIGMIDTTRTTSVTRSGVSADIRTIMEGWTREDRFGRNEFLDRVKNSNLFGCAVEPGCRHNYRRDREGREIHDTTTIVVCLFSNGRRDRTDRRFVDQ